MSSSTNTYTAWNKRHTPENKYPQYEDSNKILINSVEKGKINKKTNKPISAFHMPNALNPTFAIDNKLTENDRLYKSSYFDNHDVSEVLRGDYQRLNFDLDVEANEFSIEDYLLSLHQIKKILQILNIPIECVYGAAEIPDQHNKCYTCPSKQFPELNIVEILKQEFPSIMLFDNKYQHKAISIHIFVVGYYFDRTSLFNLFCDGGEHKFFKDSTYTLVKFNGTNIEEYCDKANYFSKYIDHSIYKQNGAQQQFRFILSGKLEQDRPHAQYTKEQFIEVRDNFNNYVSTKTESDTIFISPNDVKYQNLKNWLDSFTGKLKTTHKSRRTPQDTLIVEISTEIEHIDKNIVYIEGDYTFTDNLKECIKKNEHMNHINWICTLIKHIKWYIMEHPEATNKEIQKVFTAPYYQYYSHSQQKKLCQPQSISWCIKKIRAEGDKVFNPYSVIRWYHSELKKSAENPEINNKLTCLKYTFEEFKELVSQGVTYTQLAIYIHFTFIFFSDQDADQNTVTQIAFKDEKDKLIMIDLKQFWINRSDDPIIVQLYRKCLMVDGRRKNDEGTEEIIKQFIPLKLAFTIFRKFKQTFYKYDIYSFDKDTFSLYCQPTTAEKTEIPEAAKKIVESLSTEFNDEINKLVVNPEKYNYILDWFAYILQHPEDRNATALHIVSDQGIGKNILSNAICDYIGRAYSKPNLNINKDLLGDYTIQFDKYLLCVINEVDESKKAIDNLKTLITDPEVGVNIKYGPKYQCVNKPSYLFYSNHQDTKLIPSGDRRFTYIYSRAIPQPAQWYADVCEGKSRFKKEIADQFIKHLLSRDLTDYRSTTCKKFDKPDLIDARRDEKRHPVYLLILNTLKIYEKFGMNHISKEFVKELLDKVLKSNYTILTEDDTITESIFAQNIYKIIGYSEDDEGKEFKDVLVAKYPKLTTEDIDEIIELMGTMKKLEMDTKSDPKLQKGISQKALNTIVQYDDNQYISPRRCTAGPDRDKQCIYLKSAMQQQ